jgi:hypothetical protein
MRALRFRSLAVFSTFGTQRFYGGQDGARPPPPSAGRYPRGSGGPRAGSRSGPSEPQIIARLLALFPPGKGFVPVNKWASLLPDEVQEALVPYGGLSAFTRSQVNFFIVRQENGVTVVSLSPMGGELSNQQAAKEKREQQRAEKLKEKQARYAQRSRTPRTYVPPSQRK